MAAKRHRVLKQALLSALHGEHEFGDRHVRDRFEGGAKPAVELIDAAGQVDVDRKRRRAMESDREVRQNMVRRAQEDGTFERLVEKRSRSLGVADQRARWTLRTVARTGRELNPRADGVDVALVEKLALWQHDLGRGEVRFPGPWAHHRAQLRMACPARGAAEVE